MQRDARTYLYDMQRAAQLIQQFTAGRNFDDYLTDAMLRAAVEHQFEIIGEAMTQLSQVDSALATQITEYQSIIALRNILIHGYASVNHRLVWGVVETKLSVLQQELADLLAEP